MSLTAYENALYTADICINLQCLLCGAVLQARKAGAQAGWGFSKPHQVWPKPDRSAAAVLGPLRQVSAGRMHLRNPSSHLQCSAILIWLKHTYFGSNDRSRHQTPP